MGAVEFHPWHTASHRMAQRLDCFPRVLFGEFPRRHIRLKVGMITSGLIGKRLAVFDRTISAARPAIGGIVQMWILTWHRVLGSMRCGCPSSGVASSRRRIVFPRALCNAIAGCWRTCISAALNRPFLFIISPTHVGSSKGEHFSMRMRQHASSASLAVWLKGSDISASFGSHSTNPMSTQPWDT